MYEDGGRGGIIRGTVSFSGLVGRLALRFGLCIYAFAASQLERCHTRGLSSVAVQRVELLWNFNM